MSLTLREVQLDDLETFRRWRADPRYADMLRRPGTPTTEIEAINWYQSHREDWWWSVWENGRGLTRLRGYVMLTPREGGAEVSVLTDPDDPCDREALDLAIGKATNLLIRRLYAETYTAARDDLVDAAGFTRVAHWTLLLQTPDPGVSPTPPAPESPPPP